MLTKYSAVKELIKSTDKEIVEVRASATEKMYLIEKLRSIQSRDALEQEAKIAQAVDEILNSKISTKKSSYEYDKQVLKQFKTNELEKLAIRRSRLESKDNVDATDYKLAFSQLADIQKSIESQLFKFISKEDAELFKEVGYGLSVDCTRGIDYVIEDMEYLYNLDNYEQVSTKLGGYELSLDKFELETIAVVFLITIVLLLMVKYVVLLPMLVYILGCLYSRIRHYYNMLQVLDAYNIVSSAIYKSIDSYDENVSKALQLSLDKLTTVGMFLEEVCNNIAEAIDKKLSQDIALIRSNFDYESAKKEALKTIDVEENHMEETIEKEQNEYNELMEELTKLSNDLDGYKNDLAKLKEAISSVYKELRPSFSEKLILKEFFLGFDSVEEPVTFKYGGKATLILYDGTSPSQIQHVMTTIKMMCGQIMCSMYPLSYSIEVVDCYKSGVDLAPFQVKDSSSDTGGNTDLFKITTTSSSTKEHVKYLYGEFHNRRVGILGNYADVEAYNIHKMKFNARTAKYLVSFFYDFDYKIMEDEMFAQLCRVSETVGIIPIVFVDFNLFGDTDKDKKEDYPYKPEVLRKALDLFDGNNVYGFNIGGDSVDILNYDVKKLKTKF